MTLFHELFDATAERVPDRAALRHRGREYSYQALRERSQHLAAGLRRAGVARGDRVVLYLQNRPEVVEAALACSRLGAIFVPANPMLKNRQLGHVLKDCDAVLIVTSGAALASVAQLLPGCPALQTVVVTDPPAPSANSPGTVVPYEDLLVAAAESAVPAAIDKDPAAILYTSGSTGKPKGVVVSHRNLVDGARCVAKYLGNVPDDRLLAALPLSFDYGFSQVSTAFVVGACAVLTHYSTATALIQEVSGESITGLAGVPTMWAHLSAGEWPAEGVALRYLTSSGGALAPAILRKLQARLPKTRIFCMYGLTEAFRSTYLEPERISERAGSIGKAIPNQEVLVVRPDGTPCAAGEVGELVHRGSLVTLGYWNDAERTRLRFRPLPPRNQGLLGEIAVWSGDLVRADAEGYLYFVGRNDDLIKSSGYRISPTEIEELALEVIGVIEAMVVGMPDEMLGQRLVLALMVDHRAGADIVETARQYCRMNLPPYMVPALVQVVASIPRNANGKADRAALLAQLQQSLPEAGNPIDSRIAS